MSAATDWFDRHTADAPAALRERARAHLEAALARGPALALPDVLAAAGCAALEVVTAHPGDRSVALDLLAADALVTLALLAQAQTAPARLDAFAAGLLESWRPPRDAATVPA